MKKVLYILILLLLPVFGLGQIITTYAGGGTSGLGDGGQASAAQLGPSPGIAADATGNFYIADANQQRVRKVNAATGIITTIAGTGTAGYNGDGIPATSAELNYPVIVVLDTYGNIYISEANNRIRKVNAATGIISTYAGNGIYGSSGDGGQATNAQIETNYIAFDLFGNLYIGENYKIRKVDAAGIITTVAGNGTHGIAIDGIAATATAINNPQGLCTDVSGNIYLTDSNNTVRKINIGTGLISRVAGTGDYAAYPYLGDGLQATASHIGPFGIGIDISGNLYISDFANQRIEKVDALGIIHTIAGNGTSGFSGDGGPATSAQIYGSENVTTDLCNNVYIADFGNSRIRKVTYPISHPSITISGISSASIGNSIFLTAGISGGCCNDTITWMNHGIVFATTIVPYITYVKTNAIDSITAKVKGCGDSSVSLIHIIGNNVQVASFVHNNKIAFYPNPVTADLVINAAGSKVSDVSVFNLLGKAVFEQTYDDEKQVKVNMADLAKGLYFIRVNGVYVQRVVKE